MQAEVIQKVGSDQVQLLIQIEDPHAAARDPLCVKIEADEDPEDDAEGGEWVVEQTVLKDWVGSSSARCFLSRWRQVAAVEPSSVPTEVLQTLRGGSCT